MKLTRLTGDLHRKKAWPKVTRTAGNMQCWRQLIMATCRQARPGRPGFLASVLHFWDRQMWRRWWWWWRWWSRCWWWCWLCGRRATLTFAVPGEKKIERESERALRRIYTIYSHLSACQTAGRNSRGREKWGRGSAGHNVVCHAQNIGCENCLKMNQLCCGTWWMGSQSGGQLAGWQP